MSIRIFTTGGTFDKIYFDAKSEFHIGGPMASALLEEANVNFDYDIESLLKKDSLDMDAADRALIRNAVAAADRDRILITHGTDSMVETAQSLLDIPAKTIVLFGAMQPARMRYSDAMYLAMNGQIFDPRQVAKNRARSRFESST
jgi:L-asparaginase